MPRGDDANETPTKHVDRSGLGGAGASDEDGLAAQDRFPKNGEALGLQGRAGFDNVGDDVGHAEGDCRLDRTVESDHVGRNAVLREVRLHQAGIARRHPATTDVRDVAHLAGAGGIPKGGGTEAEGHDFLGTAARVKEQVAAGDPGVNGARADVDRDVTRAQVEELDVVVGVVADQFLGVSSGAIARFAEHVERGAGERSLVGDGNAQHRGTFGA